MHELLIKLGSLTDVQDFVRAASQQHFSIEAISGEDRIDAKSFMGLFSLDLREPIHITVDGDESEVAHFCRAISPLLLRS
ncbi:MAG: HPr family phosphocarrier protein [Ruminococcaceae bacterium]|nr:HPr family phosphocarrier protein [Oscillospiraceae bacterium]